MGRTPTGLQRICGNFHSISSLLDLPCSRTRPSPEISTKVLELLQGHLRLSQPRRELRGKKGGRGGGGGGGGNGGDDGKRGGEVCVHRLSQKTRHSLTDRCANFCSLV